MERYDLLLARQWIGKALMRLNKVYNIDLVISDVMYSDLMGWNFIKVLLYNKDIRFDSMLNEFIFTREDAMTKLDTAAGILGKNLTEDQKIILRIAYTILRDYKTAMKEPKDD